MDSTPGRDQLVFFEPRADRPVAEQPALHDMLTRPRRHFRDPLWWLLTIAGVVLFFVPELRLGFAAPTILTLFGLLGLAVAARFAFSRGLGALSASTPRQLTLGDGDLLWSGRVVAIRLPDQNAWAVGRLPVADATMVARLRRVWVFGPSHSKRIGLFVPGGTEPQVVRLAPEPPADADPVPALTPPAEWPPRDDPAVRFVYRRGLVTSLCVLELCFAAAGWLAADLLDGNARWATLAALLALDVVVVASAIVRIARASRSITWTWTPVEVFEPPAPLPRQRWVTLRVRVDMPYDPIDLVLTGPPAFLLTVYESRQLWLIGDLRLRRVKAAGIPEVPILARAIVRSTPFAGR